MAVGLSEDFIEPGSSFAPDDRVPAVQGTVITLPFWARTA